MDNSRKENKMIFICWLVYTVAYLGRLNFSASIVAVVSEMGIQKSEAGLVSSFFFFAYGIGQLVNGILSKRYNNRKMVFISLFVSSWLNLAMPLCGNISVMKYIWLVNGAVQSILWCTLIKTISENVSDEKMSKAIVVMSTPTAAGTILAYGFSALFVKLLTWRITFYVAAAALMATAFVWYVIYGKNENYRAEIVSEENKSSKLPSYVVVVLITLALAGIANGFVKDGMNTWVSSVLNEEFGVSESLSILLTLLMPLVSMIGATFVAAIHKKIKSHSMMNLIFYAVGAVVCAGVLLALKVHSIVMVMALFVIVACLMSMVNNVITSVYPLDGRKLIGSGFLAGLLNTFCYVGSTVTSYSLGSVADKQGWNPVFIIMMSVCVAAAVFSVAGIISEKREIKE